MYTRNDIEPLYIETHHKKDKNILFNVKYRPPKNDMAVSEHFCENMLSTNNKRSKNFIFDGDLNINFLGYESNKKIFE